MSGTDGASSSSSSTCGARAPPVWFRTPVAQTMTLGGVFFCVFASYTTIQFYARTTYGPALSANCVSTVYMTFTVACLVAPTVVNQVPDGSRRALFWGVLGYAALVAASLVYFVLGRPFQFIVILGGGILGIGAALLWTGQGRLILDYASVAPEQSGRIMGIFWAVFQCSALVGGAITFVFYSNTTPSSTDQGDDDGTANASVGLYLIFLGFIFLGALSTQLLLSPADLIVPRQSIPQSETTLLSDDSQPSLGSVVETDERNEPSNSKTADTQDDNTAVVWYHETWATLRFGGTPCMMRLSCLFFYTGFNQPYQQATFSNRFFTKRTIGCAMILFHVFEIVGAVTVGRALDGATSSSSTTTTTIGTTGQRRRRAAVQCLMVFGLVNTTGNLLAWYQEQTYHGKNTGVAALDIITDFPHVLLPSTALALWGFADALIQVYVYWLLGTLYTSGETHARAVGCYKCWQSLGVSLGFAVTPLSRLSALGQLALSSTIYVVGVALAFGQLPPMDG